MSILPGRSFNLRHCSVAVWECRKTRGLCSTSNAVLQEFKRKRLDRVACSGLSEVEISVLPMFHFATLVLKPNGALKFNCHSLRERGRFLGSYAMDLGLCKWRTTTFPKKSKLCSQNYMKLLLQYLGCCFNY